ncbi:hypothetical protein GCM10022631_17500 [Deinococcus rubellus]
MLPGRRFAVTAHPDKASEIQRDDAPKKVFAAEPAIGQEMNRFAAGSDFQGKSAKEFQSQLCWGGLPFAPPDQE